MTTKGTDERRRIHSFDDIKRGRNVLAIMRLSHEFRDAVDRVAKRLELTPTDFGLLVVIEELRTVSSSALMNAVPYPRSTVFTALSRLNARKLIRIDAVLHDKRARNLFMTAEGSKCVNELCGLIGQAAKFDLDKNSERIRFLLSQVKSG